MHGILFDLDGTLLDLDIQVFLRRYFGAMSEMTARHFPGLDTMPSILASTEAMQRPHPGLTNRDVFCEDFLERTGVDLTQHWDVFDEFYADVFPTLGDGYKPMPGAREAVEAALDLGLKVAIATQPIFPRAAVDARMAWADVADLPVHVVTTYEYMHACKPQAAYFRETAEMLGCAPAECLMVGDDRGLDLPAADTGMRTFYVGGATGTSADFSGPLTELPHLLHRLTGAGVEL
ncbi:MAG: HAD family hydrolase [Coriobacteriia bacterium]|nr:HAD family hydrolase [Coriobacteriia bacterium]